MKVEIKNLYLKPAIDFLFNLELERKQSRHRTKFIKQMNERLKEVGEERMEIVKDNANLDEEGNPIEKDGEYDIYDKQKFDKEIKELFDESLVIEGGDNQQMLETVSKVLKEDKSKLKGTKAAVRDYLCDQFQIDKEGE
ncbi:hypothetical protein [Oceanobacillus oncorhynchi]|uniref:hypothetical protein n=1 Tax=Oceanobacillus oncorhynchi TaxID=545501 RepID=UPI00186693F3|nr:hypothetical protein [Oceanobacillus oncorhynchi]